jgi:hypothetical protein
VSSKIDYGGFKKQFDDGLLLMEKEQDRQTGRQAMIHLFLRLPKEREWLLQCDVEQHYAVAKRLKEQQLLCILLTERDSYR